MAIKPSDIPSHVAIQIADHRDQIDAILRQAFSRESPPETVAYNQIDTITRPTAELPQEWRREVAAALVAEYRAAGWEVEEQWKTIEHQAGMVSYRHQIGFRRPKTT